MSNDKLATVFLIHITTVKFFIPEMATSVEYDLSMLIERISQEVSPNDLQYTRVCFLLGSILPDSAPKTVLNGSNLLSQIYNKTLKDRAEGRAKFWYVLKETSGCSDDLLQELRKYIPETYVLPKEIAAQVHLRGLILKIVPELANDQAVATGLINTAGSTLKPPVRLSALPKPSDSNDYTLPLLKFFEIAEQRCAVEPDDLDNLRKWLEDAGCQKVIKNHLDTFDHQKEIRILSKPAKRALPSLCMPIYLSQVQTVIHWAPHLIVQVVTTLYFS